MKCFYHGVDFDGICSSEIVKYRYPDCELFPWNYGDSFDRNTVTPNETFVLVDLSFPEEDMFWLRENTNFIWIDHHSSAIEKYKNCPFFGLRMNGKAACELAWEYFFPGEETPYGVSLLGRYDVFDLSWHEDVELFQYFIKADKYERKDWHALFTYRASKDNQYFREAHKTGKLIQTYKDLERLDMIKQYAFATTLNNLRLVACNRRDTSQLFDSVWDEEKFDAMCNFVYTADNKWYVSLYTPKKDVDVSKVASFYGGGGHKGAAGFKCDSLPFVAEERIKE